MIAKGGIKRATVEAVLIKADGTKIDLGIIADTQNKKGLIKLMKGWVSKNG